MKLLLGVLEKPIHNLCKKMPENGLSSSLIILPNFAIDPKSHNLVYGLGLCFELELAICCGNSALSHGSLSHGNKNSHIATFAPNHQQSVKKKKLDRVKSAPGGVPLGPEGVAKVGDFFCLHCNFPRNCILFAVGGHFEQHIHVHRPPAASRHSHVPHVIAFGLQLNISIIMEYLLKISSIPVAVKLLKKTLKLDTGKHRFGTQSNAGVATMQKLLQKSCVADVFVSLGQSYSHLLSSGTINDEIERHTSEMGAVLLNLRISGLKAVTRLHQLQVGNIPHQSLHDGAVAAPSLDIFLQKLFLDCITGIIPFLVILELSNAKHDNGGVGSLNEAKVLCI